jgi:GNAT superfamily N-acetyltransferase
MTWNRKTGEQQGQQLNQDIVVVQASPKDVLIVFALVEEAAAWLLARGLSQWPRYIPETGRQHIAEHAARGGVFLALRHGQPIGTIQLYHDDYETWGEDEGHALYVHGLVVSRAAAGQGIGGWLLSWAEVQARKAGKDLLRLDCWAENAALVAYYQRAGFTLVRVVGAGRPSALFERRVT